jgi:hypothetical protein
MRNAEQWLRGLSTAIVLLIAASGCAAKQSLSRLTAADNAAVNPPAVQDCACISVGSPSQFECGGKVYTSYQLAHLREANNQQQRP